MQVGTQDGCAHLMIQILKIPVDGGGHCTLQCLILIPLFKWIRFIRLWKKVVFRSDYPFFQSKQGIKNLIGRIR